MIIPRVKENKELVYMTRSMVSATLPHSKPEKDIFQRQNGNYVLTMTANPLFGLPYGSTPRALMIWITTEAVKNQSPELNLGKSFAAFLKNLGMRNSGGKRGNTTRIRDQMMRLLTCNISSIYQDKKSGICNANQSHISSSFQLWWNPLQPEQKEFIQNSKIILSKDFYDELVKGSIPIDYCAFSVLRRSPLQIDIYIWLTYRFFFLKEQVFIPWASLKHQFGCDYTNDLQGLRNFKRKFLQALKKVWLIYPEANVSPEENGLTLYPSDTHVKKKSKQANKPVDNSGYPQCNGTAL